MTSGGGSVGGRKCAGGCYGASRCFVGTLCVAGLTGWACRASRAPPRGPASGRSIAGTGCALQWSIGMESDRQECQYDETSPSSRRLELNAVLCSPHALLGRKGAHSRLRSLCLSVRQERNEPRALLRRALTVNRAPCALPAPPSATQLLWDSLKRSPHRQGRRAARPPAAATHPPPAASRRSPLCRPSPATSSTQPWRPRSTWPSASRRASATASCPTASAWRSARRTGAAGAWGLGLVLRLAAVQSAGLWHPFAIAPSVRRVLLIVPPMGNASAALHSADPHPMPPPTTATRSVKDHCIARGFSWGASVAQTVCTEQARARGAQGAVAWPATGRALSCRAALCRPCDVNASVSRLLPLLHCSNDLPIHPLQDYYDELVRAFRYQKRVSNE